MEHLLTNEMFNLYDFYEVRIELLNVADEGLKAAELNRGRTATIAEIAYDTGFSSPSYFTDCFKKYFGKSPSEYQRSVEG
jgi:AraC-like DNA-binding protein